MKTANPSQLISVAAAFLALAGVSSAGSIGINFGADKSSLAVTDSAGVVAQTNWNNASGKIGNIDALLDDTGAESGASLVWTTDETWHAGNPGSNADGKLLQGFVSENNEGTDSTIDITGIPYAAYDIYIYLNHDRNFEDVRLTEANNAFPQFDAVENNPALNPVTWAEQTTSATEAGNYVRFQGVTAGALSIALGAIDVNYNGGGTIQRNAITGIQIVEVFVDDTDGDGMTNQWEIDHGLDPNDDGSTDPNNGADGDPDGDTLKNIDEMRLGTHPNKADTDDDGLRDDKEDNTGTYMNADHTGTNPVKDDTDGDNLLDGVEDNTRTWRDADHTGTDPNNADTDGDTYTDGVEDNSGIYADANNPGTDPNKEDTDGDGMRDDWEAKNWLDPNDDGSTDPINGATGDPDSDGLNNISEMGLGTDPQVDDTDQDGLPDGVENNTGTWTDADHTGTDPLEPDSDLDGLPDGMEDNSGNYVDADHPGTDPNTDDTDTDGLDDKWEVDNGLSPVDDGSTDPDNGATGDPDGDTLTNEDEWILGTDPKSDDTDQDGLRDDYETADGNYVGPTETGTDPLVADTDGDTLPDNVEDNTGTYAGADHTGTNPNLADTDDDGFRDDYEIDNGFDPIVPGDLEPTGHTIGINFGAGHGADASLDPADQAGVFAQANWNNAAGKDGTLALTDESGAANGTEVTWTSREQWGKGNPVVPDGKLLKGWLACGTEGASVADITIDITGIPYAAYDVVIYMNHDRASEDADVTGPWGTFRIRENDPAVNADPVVLAQQVGPADPDDPDNNEKGNFVIFSGVSGADLNLVIGAGHEAAGNSRGMISGLQIIERPAGAPKLKITDIVRAPSGEATLTWESEAGATYAVDISADLTENGWSELATGIPGAADSTSYTDTAAATEPRRFYRVRRAD